MTESVFYRLKTKVKGIAPSALEHQGAFFFFHSNFLDMTLSKGYFKSMVLKVSTGPLGR